MLNLPKLTYAERQAIDALPDCHDCGAQAGDLHGNGCDVEQCPICGGQLLSCGHRPRTRRIPWLGEWPGSAACREFGWYCLWSPSDGWVRCGADQPGATEDLNRLHIEAEWDRKAQRFVQRAQSARIAAGDASEGEGGWE